MSDDFGNDFGNDFAIGEDAPVGTGDGGENRLGLGLHLGLLKKALFFILSLGGFFNGS